MATRKTNAQLQAEVDDLSGKAAELEMLQKRLVRSTLEYGRQNDSCNDGMAEFIADALDVPQHRAMEMMGQWGTQTYKVTLTFEGPLGWDPDDDAMLQDVATALNRGDYDRNHDVTIDESVEVNE